MASLKEVKGRILSVQSTQQITKAMKMVAAAKLRKSQDRILQMRPFAQKLNGILQNLSSAGSEPAWYNKTPEESRILIVPVSADRGLCGSFNGNIFKATGRLLKEKYKTQFDQGNVTILPLGKKANDYFSKRNYKMISDYWRIYQNLSFDSISEIADFIMRSFAGGDFDKVEIVYNEFKNVATQNLIVEQYLPIMPPQGNESSEVDYIYQPDQEEIISGLIPKSLRVQLFKATLESDASFNGAQMTAMDKATENAGDLIKDLKLTYNRTRQAAITKEILEIVAGAEALKSA